MVDSVPIWRLSLYWPIQSDHLSIADRMIPPLRQEHSHGKTQCIPGKQVLVRSWPWKIYHGFIMSFKGSFFKKIYLNWVCTLDGKGIQTTNILAFLACKIWEYTKESVSMVILHIVLLSRHPHILYYWLWSTVLWHKASYPLLMHRLVWLCGLAFSYLPTPFIALVTGFFLSTKEPGSIKTF